MDTMQKKRFEALREVIASRAGDYRAAAEAQSRVWEDAAGETQRRMWEDAARFNKIGTDTGDGPPLLLTAGLPEPYDGFDRYNPGEIHHDKDKMLLNGMLDMAGAAFGGMQAVPSLRANMGCGIFPSMFPGIKQRLFYDARMPWVVEHLSKERISALGDGDIGETDEFKLALEHMEYLAAQTAGTGAFVYPLDVQGPFDIAHLVYGDAIFYDLYDDPPFIRHLMDLSRHAIITGLEECLKRIPGSDEYIAHYNSVALPRSLGGIKLSEDTSTLISNDHLDEYAVPATARVLDHFGGGYVHYCGKHEGLFERLLGLPLVRGFNFGNPEFHDMDAMLARMASAGKVYYGGVNALPGETRRGFFARVRNSATAHDNRPNGAPRLLLQYHARFEERGQVCEDWRAAGEPA